MNAYKDLLKMPFKSRIIKKILLPEMASQVNSDTINKKRQELLLLKDMTPSEISWSYCCDRAKISKCSQLYIALIAGLLDHNLYQMDHSEILYKSKALLIEIYHRKIFSLYQKVLCGDLIENIVLVHRLYKSNHNNYISLFYLRSHNQDFQNILYRFCGNTERKYSRYCTQKFVSEFEISLGKYVDSIHSVNDFTEDIFWMQLQYMCQDIKKNHNGIDDCKISGTVFFYRWLCGSVPEYTMLDHPKKISKTLLFNPGFVRMIHDGFHFMIFDPKNIPSGHDKYIITAFGFTKFSSRLTDGSWFRLDLSDVHSIFYKNLIIKYFFNYENTLTSITAGSIVYMSRGMHLLEELKAQPNYPNPDQDNLTSQEAYYLRMQLLDDKFSLRSLNNKIGWIKRLLLWANVNDLVKTDEMFFDYLSQYEEPSKTHGNPIPKEDLIKILVVLKNRAETGSIKDKHIYTLTCLALETEFRMGNLCALTIDCIRPSFKPGRYQIVTNTKTSHRRFENHEITEDVHKLLMKSIDITSSIRDRCNDENRNFIFIVPGLAESVHKMRTFDFTNSFYTITKSLFEDKGYCAKNLRDTHMSQAVAWAIASGKTDMELGLVTRHVRFETTLNNYVGPMLEKMLEATYQIVIGDMSWIGADQKIVNSLNKEINNASHIVEDGTGNCTLDDCYKATHNIVNSLPVMFATILSQLNRMKNTFYRRYHRLIRS